MPRPRLHRSLRAAQVARCLRLGVAWVALLPLVGGSWARCTVAPSAEAALQRLNAERAHGASCPGQSDAPVPAGPLHWNAGLATVAADLADDLAQARRLAHRDGAGRPLAARLAASGYRFTMAVENTAVGYASIDAVIDAWLASGVHCANLMNHAALDLGLACSDAGPDPQDRYWTLVLGKPPG